MTYPFVVCIRICAWCGEELGRTLVAKDEHTQEDFETHGICRTCERVQFGSACDCDEHGGEGRYEEFHIRLDGTAK